jgi:hypothetical protein
MSENVSDNLVAPDSYILLAIFSTLFCFFPLGIFSLINALKVSRLWKQKKYEQARIASDKAIKYGQLALIFGGLFWIIVYIY